MTWRTAHRVAGIAAVHAHRDLHVSEDGYVDIFSGMQHLDVAVMAQPMPRLFGVYLPPGKGLCGGILLNSGLDPTTLRHSAAHEVGHHALKHGRCFSKDMDPFAQNTDRVWSYEEKQAEAFAAWFLMPSRAVKQTMRRLGMSMVGDYGDAYQLSLHLGTSYRGMLRHLQNLRLITAAMAAAWSRVQPAKVRARAVGDTACLPPRVWVIGEAAAGMALHVEAGDRLILEGAWAGNATDAVLPEGVTPAHSPSGLQCRAHFDISADLQPGTGISLKSTTDGTAWSVDLIAVPATRVGLLAEPPRRNR